MVSGGSERQGPLRKELLGILSEGIPSVTVRERTTFDKLLLNYGGLLAFFGAGLMGEKALAVARSRGNTPVAFADNNPKKWGTYIDGIPVLSPRETLSRFGHNPAFAVTVWSHFHSHLDIQKQLRNLNCDRVIPFPALAWKFADELLPYYHLDLPHKMLENSLRVLDTFDLLCDEESRRQFVAYIRWLILLDFAGLPTPAPADHYFPQDLLSISPEEVFIDCGAFNGDTMDAFLGRVGPFFKKIVAYEADPLNFVMLQEYTSTLAERDRKKIELRNCACMGKVGVVSFESSNSAAASVSQSGAITVKTVSLDDDLSGIKPTFVKLDIEGSELETLMGAQKTIRDSKPIVAVSIYHRQMDICDIPLYLHSLYSDYRFYLRSHRPDGWDTVLYAIPPLRVIL